MGNYYTEHPAQIQEGVVTSKIKLRQLSMLCKR